ncbi:MAG: chemotaxis protein CheD [Armatimonadetes bacterium]|nr:chemotaxis protein CheD [Armatimonadota bacterium]
MGKIVVSLGEIKTSGNRDDVLVGVALGSCVGVVMYDPAVSVGGMAHVMLPDSAFSVSSSEPGKTADTAIPALIEALKSLGAQHERIRAVIAGGASLLPIALAGKQQQGIGAKNTEAVQAQLLKRCIPVIAKDVGGAKGRTMKLYMENGLITTKKAENQEENLAILGNRKAGRLKLSSGL